MPPLTRSLPALALLLCAAMPGPATTAQPGELDLHGMRLAPSCRADTWPEAQQAIEQAARGRSTPALVALLQTFLCADDEAAARARIARHAPRRILQLSEGTGEKPSRQRVPAGQALSPQGGRVHGLQLRQAGPAGIALHWQADEACVRSVSLAHRAGGWVFVEAGSACD